MRPPAPALALALLLLTVPALADPGGSDAPGMGEAPQALAPGVHAGTLGPGDLSDAYLLSHGAGEGVKLRFESPLTAERPRLRVCEWVVAEQRPDAYWCADRHLHPASDFLVWRQVSATRHLWVAVHLPAEPAAEVPYNLTVALENPPDTALTSFTHSPVEDLPGLHLRRHRFDLTVANLGGERERSAVTLILRGTTPGSGFESLFDGMWWLAPGESRAVTFESDRYLGDFTYEVYVAGNMLWDADRSNNRLGGDHDGLPGQVTIDTQPRFLRP